MNQLDPGGGGSPPKKHKKPPSIIVPKSPIPIYGSPSNGGSGSSGGSNSSTHIPVPQTVYHSTILKHPVQPYSITRSAWGSSGFPKQSNRLANILPKLRSRLNDEPTFNSLLSQLMNDRYDQFNDRNERQFSNQRAQYQRDLNTALVEKREGLPFEMPDKPKIPHIARGQNTRGLLNTFMHSIKPGMPKEVKDAYSQFYKYELTRLLDYKNDLRGQRNSLHGYTQNFKTDVSSLDDRQAVGENTSTVAGADSRHPDPSLAVGKNGKIKGGSVSGIDPKNPLAAFGFHDTDGNEGHTDNLPIDSGGNDDRGGGLLGKLFGAAASPYQHIQDAENAVFGAIAGEAEDPLYWTIDKLSRPLYGTANATNAFLNEDKNVGKGSDHWYSPDIHGPDAIDAFQTLFSDPGDFKKLGSAFKEGFEGHEKMTFSGVIGSQAARDDQHDWRDSKFWQQPAGFGIDLAADPLMYVGLGLVTKPVKATTDLAQARSLMKVSRDTADLLNKADKPFGPAERELKPRDVYNLMAGTGKVAKQGDKTKSVAETTYNTHRLIQRLEQAEFSPDDAKLLSYQRTANVLHEQREAQLQDFQGSTVVESLRHDLEIKVASGSEPHSALEEFDDLLTSTYIEPKIIEANMYHQYLKKQAAKVFDTRDERYTKEGTPSKGQKVNVPKGPGSMQTINVPGATKQVPGAIKERAWDRVVRDYENASKHAKKTGDPKHLRYAENLRKKIETVLNDAPGAPLSESMPQLAKDFRISPEQLDSLVEDSRRAVWDTPEGHRLFSRSMAINKDLNTRGAYTKDEAASARYRKEHTDRRLNRMWSDAAVKIIKSHITGEELYKNENRVREIRAEIRALRKQNKDEFGVPEIKDTKSKHETTDERELTPSEAHSQRMSDLYTELKELKGYAPTGKVHDLTADVPSHFAITNKETGELEGIDFDKLRSAIGVDIRKGKHDVSDTYLNIHVRRAADKIDDGTYSWLHKVRLALQDRYDPIFAQLHDPIVAERHKIKSQGLVPTHADNERFLNATRQAAKTAEDRAWTIMKNDSGTGRLKLSEHYDEVKLQTVGPHSPEKDLIRALKLKYGEKEAALKLEKYTAQRTKQDDVVKSIDEQLEGLKQKSRAETIRQNEIVKESYEAKKVMRKRLKEDALLTAVQMAVVPGVRNSLALKTIAGDLTIPGSHAMFDAVEKMSGLRLSKWTRQIYANTFKSPMSKIPEEMQLAAARALGQTPVIIEHHVMHLKNTLGQVPEGDRIRAFDGMLKGHGVITGEEGTQEAIASAFNDLMPFFQRKSNPQLSVEDINRYLPEEFRLNEAYVNKHGVDTPQKLISAIRANKVTDRADRSQLKDPYRISWALRIGTEQASARKALINTVNGGFGVKDVNAIADLTPEFTKLGWTKIHELGNTHYFPPEVVPDIKNLLKMLEPRNISDLGRTFDHITGYWKTMTTVYNPGYWTRNGIGEVMSSWLDGVNHPKWYKGAFDVVKYARGDGKELDALKQQFSLMHHVQSESVTGSTKIGKLGDGSPITAEQAWVAYNDQGLKTGFINTEFDQQFSRAGDKLRSATGTQGFANMHSKVRGAGEWYEDGLRMAHFLHAMEHSGAKTLDAAANYAAKKVRKYHFDYTDFSNFEKTVMLRAFPFYKWTRKALPLMTTMLFTKPGKMMAYPKAMNALQNTVTTQDISGDNNGFAPNYGELVPGWIQDLWGYQVAGEEKEGSTSTFFNLATPQMDSLKAMISPGPTAYGLLNPLIKGPVELAQIATGNGGKQSILQQTANKADFSKNDPMNVELQSEDQNQKQASLQDLFKQMPQTNFLFNKTGVADGNPGVNSPSDQELASFLTGLGLYQNNDARRMGVMFENQNK